MDVKVGNRPSSVTLAQILLVVSVAESILTFAFVLLRPDATSHLPAVTWVQNIGFWVVWIALVVLLGRRQGWARFGVLALLAWNIGNFTLFLLMRPRGAPPMWLLSQVPTLAIIQAVGLVAMCIVFWTSWQRATRVPTFWLWIAVGVCSLPVSGRDWRGLQIVFSLTTLRVCSASLLFKRESNEWFSGLLPQKHSVSQDAAEGRMKIPAQEPKKTREPVNQKDGAPPIVIDPQTITHAFFALTLNDIKHSAAAESALVDLNRRCQPRIWDVPFRAKFITFAVNPKTDGFPDPGLVVAALETNGLAYPSSIVANLLVISFDGGKSRSHVAVGFAFRDDTPRFILPYSGGCVAP